MTAKQLFKTNLHLFALFYVKHFLRPTLRPNENDHFYSAAAFNTAKERMF